jgi:hypothetical protein
MSTPAQPVVAATPAPAQKLTSIQIIEQELGNFFKQKEQAIANVNAVEGAIQAAQHLLNRLRQEAAKAEAEAKKLLDEAKTEVAKGIALVETEAKKL